MIEILVHLVWVWPRARQDQGLEICEIGGLDDKFQSHVTHSYWLSGGALNQS